MYLKSKVRYFESELNYNYSHLQSMTAIFKGLFRWSLEITGASIIWYNYQPYERQQKIIGVYGSALNSYRFVKCLYGLSQDFATYRANINNQSLSAFRQSSAQRLEALCEQNLGVYARIAEILAGYTDIIPKEYTSEFKKVSSRTLEGANYEEVKNALTSLFQKDMKELFDGFQSKPLSVGLFTQSHKAVLLQNYKEAVVKVLVPSLKVQADHDIWFINKVKGYVIDYLKKNSIDEQSYKIFTEVLDEAESVVRSEIDFDQELSNVEKNKQLMYDSNSAFYVPYYYSKLCNKNIITRQFVEGIRVNDVKGLKEIGLSPEVAFAYVLTEIQHMMKKLHLITGSIKPENILVRKYIKPYKPPAIENEIEKEEARETKGKPKPVALLHPPYQVIFLAQNNIQEIPAEASDNIISFWNSLKKEKKRVPPTVSTFYERLPKYSQLKSDAFALKAQKYYLYEPLLKIYESLIKKQ